LVPRQHTSCNKHLPSSAHTFGSVMLLATARTVIRHSRWWRNAVQWEAASEHTAVLHREIQFRPSLTLHIPVGTARYQILHYAHTAVFMCFMWISEQTAIISLHGVNWFVCITETESVYCVLRTESLKKPIKVIFIFKGFIVSPKWT